VKPQVKCTTDVAQDPLQGSQMGFSRVVHVEADLLNSIGNIWSGEGEVLECACQAAKISRIRERCTINCRNLGVGVSRSRKRFAVCHTSPIKYSNMYCR